MKPYGIIYKATNIVNAKCYIGQTTKTLEDRKTGHFYERSSNVYFHNAIRKYGIDNFKWEVLCECDTKELLNIRETMKIIVNHSHYMENGYNMTWGGEGGDTITNNPNKDKILKNMCKAQSGKNNPMFGRQHTNETKQKMRKPKTNEHKLNISKSKIGKHLSDNHKNNIGLMMKGKMVGENNPMFGRHIIINRTDTWNKNNSLAHESIYNIRFPDGHLEKIKGLKTFCKEHKLCYQNMCKNIKKGWNVEKC